MPAQKRKPTTTAKPRAKRVRPDYSRVEHVHTLRTYSRGRIQKCTLPGCSYAETWNATEGRYTPVLPTSKQSASKRESAYRAVNLWDGGER